MKKPTIQHYIDVIDEAWWNKRGSPPGYPTPNPGMKAESLLGQFAAKIGKNTSDLTAADMTKFFAFLSSPAGKRKVGAANKAKKKKNPCHTKSNPTRKAGPIKWYIGVKKTGRVCFTSNVPPTAKSHGKKYNSVIGPYPTQQAALQGVT